jgi:quercetin dioxygenase-like cupin family protein
MIPIAPLLALFLPLAPQEPPPSGLVIRRADEATASIGVGEVGFLSPEPANAVGQVLLVEAPGYRTPVHVHHLTDETFYVLSGRLTLHVNGAATVLGAGDYAFIPRGTPHAQGNTGTEPTRVLLIVSPGHFVGFFRAREELVKTTPPGHAGYGPRMDALGDVYDIQNLAPPPF